VEVEGLLRSWGAVQKDEALDSSIGAVLKLLHVEYLDDIDLGILKDLWGLNLISTSPSGV
ncbi:hypothetical protein A2U01_0066053, partial [Trifolium medium]|nr:hypothetical protein [Trifolium medium]